MNCYRLFYTECAWCNSQYVYNSAAPTTFCSRDCKTMESNILNKKTSNSASNQLVVETNSHQDRIMAREIPEYF